MEDWTPEPLVAAVTPFEEAQIEKGPVIVGYVFCPFPTVNLTKADVFLCLW